MNRPSHQNAKQPAYIFDADGVLNKLNPYAVDGRVLTQIAELLNKGHYIAINTGRGYPWVKKNFIEPIRGHTTPDKMDHIFVSVEMGGLSIEFTSGVERDTPSTFSLRPDQIAQVKRVFEENPSHKDIGWYDTKMSMATIAKPEHVSIEDFAAGSQPIADKLRALFAGEHIKINHTADAIDVIAQEAGKWAGAKLIHDWLQQSPASGTTDFVCFGDNVSDYEMARYFGQQGHTVHFVFTGKQLGKVEHDPQVTLVEPSVPYSDGTYEFLLQTTKNT